VKTPQRRATFCTAGKQQYSASIKAALLHTVQVSDTTKAISLFCSRLKKKPLKLICGIVHFFCGDQFCASNKIITTMKKMYICALIICTAISASAQLGGTVVFKTTACAENLLESYRRLSARSGLTSCFTGVYSITGYMQAGCYSAQKDSGHVTFASYLNESAGGSWFHTTWDSARLGYDYYGVCYPKVMVWDIPRHSGTINHVYEAFLVNVSDYQKSLTRTFDYMKRYAVKSDQILKIVSWGYESNAGWIASKESANYNNLNSSKGLIVTVQLKTKKIITCYLLNNYDGNATLTWKSAMGTATSSFTGTETDNNLSMQLTSAVLHQSQPNPANNSTVISYTLPAKFTSAKIRITDYTGNTIKEIKLNGAGNGNINTNVQSLNAGSYKYSLLIDGMMVETKTMIVVK